MIKEYYGKMILIVPAVYTNVKERHCFLSLHFTQIVQV